MTEIAESARKVRAAPRAAFKPEISVTSSFETIKIKWEDSAGPTLEEMQGALKAGRLAEIKLAEVRQSYGTEYLAVDGHYLWFAPSNAAREEAARQARKAERKREQEAIFAARKARHPVPLASANNRQDQPTDPAVFAAFERLRERAESEVAHNSERRPSWAPPLILGDELADNCIALGYLTPEDKRIGRLWAEFATPKRSGRYLRERISTLPLHGISCRSFRLFAGGSRQSTMGILFEAQREEDGSWKFGPYWCRTAYQPPRERAWKWEDLVRERARLEHELEHWERSPTDRDRASARLAAVTTEIAAIDAEDAEKAKQHHQRPRLRRRTLELARAPVLDFIGAELDVQMQMAGRLWGHCCRCGKLLTDPPSLERGIGPDCHQHIIHWIRDLGAEGRRPESIVWLVGMSIEFVNVVLSEQSGTSDRIA
jgi:hypothetical protein